MEKYKFSIIIVASLVIGFAVGYSVTNWRLTSELSNSKAMRMIGNEPPDQSLKCQPRPACLDAIPKPCKLPEPIKGWCKSPTPIACTTAKDCGKPIVCSNGKTYPAWVCGKGVCHSVDYARDVCSDTGSVSTQTNPNTK